MQRLIRSLILHMLALQLIISMIFSSHNLIAQQKMVSLNFKNMAIHDVLKTLASQGGLNIVTSTSVKGSVTVFVENVAVMDALRLVIEMQGLAYYRSKDIIKVITAEEYQNRFGKAYINPLQTKVFRLHNTSAEQALKSIFPLKSKGGNVIADTRSNSLIVVDLPAIIRTITQVIQRIDIPLDNRTFSLSHIPASSLVTTVKDMLSSGGDVSADDMTNQLFVRDSEERIGRVEMLVKEADFPTTTRMVTFTLQYASAEAILPKIQEKLSAGVGWATADKSTNKIFVTDLPSALNNLKAFVAELDKKTRQVLIEAKIIQVVLNDKFKMGVDWTAVSKRLTGGTFSSTFRILSDTDPGISYQQAGVDAGEFTLGGLIEALSTIGKSDLLSNPRITCVSGQEAKFIVGSTIPYKTVDFRESNGVIKTFEKVITVEVGVKLNVTPIINDDDFITMKIMPEVSEVTSYIDNIPIIDKSESETTVMVKDGVTIIIGGLIRDQKIVNESRVPLLGSVPLLGIPFRSKSTSKVKTELIILLRPQIISGDVNMGTN